MILAFNPACMASMSNEHLIASLEVQRSPLVSTAAEIELIGRLEEALDANAEMLNSEDVAIAIDEAVAQYPIEGFLEQTIDRINRLAERLRGENADELKSIADSLSDIELSIVRAGEYGANELNKLIADKGQ